MKKLDCFGRRNQILETQVFRVEKSVNSAGDSEKSENKKYALKQKSKFGVCQSKKREMNENDSDSDTRCPFGTLLNPRFLLAQKFFGRNLRKTLNRKLEKFYKARHHLAYRQKF